MPIEVSDVPALLAQCAGRIALQRANQMSVRNESDLSEEFGFIPQLLLAGLLSHYQDEQQFRRILSQDWVRTWKDGHEHLTVWQHAATVIVISDDDELVNDLVSGTAQKLARLDLQNQSIDSNTDASRRLQLNAPGIGKKIGVGRVYDINACLADSLLQVLAAKRILPRSLLDSTTEARAQRSSACIDARQHLVHHADYRLHPRLRDHLGGEVTEVFADRENTYLEHHVHSEALVLFFLDYFQSTHIARPRGFKLVVYTRFDCAAIDPHAFAHTFGVSEDDVSRDTPIVLELYNNIGDGYTGVHYDPFVCI